MLSVVIITLNEEKKIRDCLESVKWADEIIVADSCSQDRTVEIAKEYTSKVYQHKLQADLAKNFGIGKASGDWILSIDADEKVTPELQAEIKETLESAEHEGYYIPRKSYFLGKWIKHCGWWPDYVLRLFRKDKGRYDEHLVHAKVVIRGKTGKLKKPLLHYTCTDLGDYIARINARTSLTVQQCGHPVSLLTCLLHAWGRFLKMYFVGAGFLDGKEGLALATLSSYDVFIRYLKLWQKGKKTYTECVEMKEKQN